MAVLESVLVIVWRTILALALIIGLAYVCFLRPPREPKNIPVIPFYVTLLPLWKDVDQQETYNKYIREPLLKHGAVKIFFASQWNVLVGDAALLAQIFKYEDQYQKSGNQKKIPGSVLASFLGDNIISAHGDTWKLYTSIMKPGLQEGWKLDPVFRNARLFTEQLLETCVKQPSETPRIVAVQDYVQRYTIANLAQVILGVDFDTMQNRTAHISQLQTSIKGQIFMPFYMNFPFFDTLGIPSRERARQAAATFTSHIASSVVQSHCQLRTEKLDTDGTALSSRLIDAWRSGQITEQQLRDNLTIVFVAGQENPQLALVSTLYLLGKHPDAQDRLYREIMAVETDQPSIDELNNLPFLAACILESLRCLPPIGQLINRLAVDDEPLLLGDHVIPPGTYLGYNSYATNRDPKIWGEDADEFVPERWGVSVEDIQKTYRRRKARAEFITFHGGRRACLGERFALLQLKVTFFTLVRGMKWSLDPTWPEKLTPAGPISPRALRIVVEKR